MHSSQDFSDIVADRDNGLGADGATQCTKEAPFQQAQAVCYEAGSRLCTVAEVLGGSTTNTGCNLNSELIWTSSPCASGAGGKASAYGCDPATTRCASIRLRSGGDEVCQTDLSAMLGVRCCADGEASRQGRSMCDVYAAEENECTSAMSCAELSARDGRNKWPIDGTRNHPEIRGTVLVCGETRIPAADGGTNEDGTSCWPEET